MEDSKTENELLVTFNIHIYWRAALDLCSMWLKWFTSQLSPVHLQLGSRNSVCNCKKMNQKENKIRENFGYYAIPTLNNTFTFFWLIIMVCEEKVHTHTNKLKIICHLRTWKVKKSITTNWLYLVWMQLQKKHHRELHANVQKHQ